MKHYALCVITFFLIVLSYHNSLAQPLSIALEQLLEQGKTLYAQQEYAKATEKFNQLIEKGKEEKDNYLLGSIYYQLGVFYDTKRNHNKALEFLFKGSKLIEGRFHTLRSNSLSSEKETFLEKEKALNSQDSQLKAYIYTRIGGVYYNQKDYSKAEKYWKTAYWIAKKNHHTKALSNILNNLGEIKRLTGHLNAALPLYKKALEIKQMIKDTFGTSVNLSNIGTVYLKMGHLDSAKMFYDKNFSLPKNSKFPRIAISHYSDYGLYHKTIGQAFIASQWYNKALVYADTLGDLNIILSIYQDLSALYEEQSKLDSCLLFQKKWIDLTQVINQQQNEKLALEIEARFRINEKEKELTFLKEKNNIEMQNNRLKDYFQWASIIGLFSILIFTLLILRLRNKNNEGLTLNMAKINQQNEEKDILLKEIHHRVKNNLQVITSLLSLQSYNIEDPKMKVLFSNSQYRINSMAMIHEMLYQSNDFSKINYNSYLKQLIDKLVISIKGVEHQIQVNIDVPDLFLNIDTAIPLGLLINEVTTNSLKYGIVDQTPGTLSIKMKMLDPPNFLLEIGDDGIGFTTDLSAQKHHSLGLNLIKQLAVQLNGTILKDDKKKGTNYILHFQEVDQMA
ncbi:histidine kinase dimerization/phosphoacceptor domain -containing protein [Aureispira anguillae]|uniref:histidine kinase n=1 Tax=Aureispira anguillae TaxID=2864201 RepID=A0A915VMN3_9BACT|nr:histidine kinase dimerization/phosphoacceptor domain -containing protein [Aureispira anguillae]BDS09384.1 tetratricopeptide repeat protein [Aureispira anguillae]